MDTSDHVTRAFGIIFISHLCDFRIRGGIEFSLFGEDGSCICLDTEEIIIFDGGQIMQEILFPVFVRIFFAIFGVLQITHT